LPRLILIIICFIFHAKRRILCAGFYLMRSRRRL
jgi:hypothetical protein